MQLLPGIGPARAAAIVADRARGAYERLDELQRVRGIGPKTLEGLRAWATIGGGGGGGNAYRDGRRPPTATAPAPRRDSESHPRPGAPGFAAGDR
ncbi:MAG: helix-hairpin-helix domain-containing protein [Planctomycetota bacterium]|nr:helix-hairpin-helix domain-containing protein [Planctomycetota bacterium]